MVRDDERSIRGCPLGDLDLGRHEVNRRSAGTLPQWLFRQAVTFGDGFCCRIRIELPNGSRRPMSVP